MKRSLYIGLYGIAVAGMLFSISLKQFHFLFSNHHVLVHEHCDHHLHSPGEHTHDCTICHLEEVVPPIPAETDDHTLKAAFTAAVVCRPATVLLQQRFNIHYLRGPPQA